MDAPGTRSKTIAWARVTLQIPCHALLDRRRDDGRPCGDDQQEFAERLAADRGHLSEPDDPEAYKQRNHSLMRCGRQLGGCLNEGKFRVRVKPFHLSRGPSVEASGPRCCPGVRGRDL